MKLFPLAALSFIAITACADSSSPSAATLSDQPVPSVAQPASAQPVAAEPVTVAEPAPPAPVTPEPAPTSEQPVAADTDHDHPVPAHEHDHDHPVPAHEHDIEPMELAIEHVTTECGFDTQLPGWDDISIFMPCEAACPMGKSLVGQHSTAWFKQDGIATGFGSRPTFLNTRSHIRVDFKPHTVFAEPLFTGLNALIDKDQAGLIEGNSTIMVGVTAMCL